MALALAAKGSGEASVLFWYGALVALYFGAVFIKAPSPNLGITPLAAAVAFLATWMVATNLWANPSYSVAAPFHAALLLGGFLLGRRASAEDLTLLFRVGTAFGVVLALGALGLQFAEREPRAHSLFVTPATLAAALNLLLVPALVVAACSDRRFGLLAAIFLMSAAFTGAQSRGGWIALGVTAVMAFMLARRSGVASEKLHVMRSVAAFALGALAWWITAMVWMGDGALHTFVDEAAPSFQARLDLYALAWRGIEQSSLLYGAGYQAFFYLLTSAGGSIANYAGRTTYFVHNDYLQALLELGIPGLAGFAFLAATPVVLAVRRGRAVPCKQERIALLAVTAAIGSMALHALADFPFYIPLCVLVFGALLGVSDALTGRVLKLVIGAPRLINPPTYKGIRAATAVIIVWLLTVPLFAELAARHAFYEWRLAQSQKAAFWFEVARRLEPRDWRYHWYAGQFWFAQAEQTRLRDAAQLADSAFAKGFDANPREGRSLFGRLMTHTKLRALLAEPADAATMLRWADRVAEIAPLDPVVREEQARIQRVFGANK